MPTSLFLQKVIDHLGFTGFKNPKDNKIHTIHNTMKEFVLSGSNLNLRILSDKAFEVTMSVETYSKALAADYFFSTQKVDKQKSCIEMFKDSALPLSWLIVTLYYGCFYSAVEVLRLTGSYCSYFSKDDCQEIRSISSNSVNLSSGNYLGTVTTDNGYIKIVFRQKVLGSHELVWDGIKKLVLTFDLSDIPMKKVSKLEFFSDVFKNQIDIEYPNVVRNKWNYSKSDAYSPEANAKYGKFRACLTDLSHALSLDLSHKKNDVELNNILFIWVLYSSLSSTISNVSSRFATS